MLRTLKPIEIAEGALLADVAVIYQLLVNYIPFVGDVFRFPIFIVFAILVLRRGLYVSIMSSCVALFIAGILMGPSLLPIFAIEIMGGLYLGVTMRFRLPHVLLILLGATCGTLAFYVLFGAVDVLTGIPVSTYIQFLHRTYVAVLNFLALIIQKIDGTFLHGLEHYWLYHIMPLLTSLGDIAFTYWWATLFVLFWGFSLISTLLIYTSTNVVMQLLEYEVDPFPSERFMRRVQHLRRRILKLLRKYRIARGSHAKI
jgi:hypothetical protein